MITKRKKSGVMYIICLLCIFILVIVGINDMKEKELLEQSTVINNGEQVSSDGKISTDSYKYAKEIAEAEKPGNIVLHIGEYPGRADSREVNSDFIIGKFVLNDYYDGAEVEILAYEEMDNISSYIDKTGVIEEYVDRYIEKLGILNSDGTFNDVTQKMRIRLDNNSYGEETVIDNYKYVAIKLKVKIRNTENKENEIHIGDILKTEGLIYMDDGKLYRDTSIYNYDYPNATFSDIIYHSFMDYFKGLKNQVPDVLTFEPFQEIEGEVIYILGEKDLDNIYIINNPMSCNIENFNGVYIQFLPFSLLKTLGNE